MMIFHASVLFSFSDEEMDYVIAVAKGETPRKPQSMRDREDLKKNNGRKRPSSPRRRDEPPPKQDRADRYWVYIGMLLV